MPRSVRYLLGFGALFFALLVFLPVFLRPRETGRTRNVCPANLKQIGLGLIMYSQDYNEKMPAARDKVGWANAIQPYLKSTQLFQCPSEKTVSSEDPKKTGYTDYFYNSQLNRIELRDIEYPAQLVMAAEGNDGREKTDASYSKSGIPEVWKEDTASPAFRHLEKANYLYFDGHVRALAVGKVSNDRSSETAYFQALAR